MVTSSSIQRGSQVLRRDTALRMRRTRRQLPTFSMEAEQRVLTLLYGLFSGGRTRGTQRSRKGKSQASNIVTWESGRSKTVRARRSKPTGTTSNGRKPVVTEAGDPQLS